MFSKGFKFGLLLQFSVGPVCLFVFTAAGEQGFWAGLSAVAAVTLVDALYILLACAGVSSLLRHGKIQWLIRCFGALILFLFGLDTLLAAFDKALLIVPNLLPSVKTANWFLQGALITASNPLTILFWSGVFSAEALEHQLQKKQLLFYGLGCLTSSFVFLTAITSIACLLQRFIPSQMITLLNIFVGIFLILFGMKLLIKRTPSVS